MQATTCFHNGVPVPSFKRRMVSFTILQRFTPPMACSIRIRIDEIRRFVSCSGGVNSPPGGFFLGWIMVIPAGNPWKPLSIQVAARWQGIACQLCQTFIRCFTFISRTQEAHVTGLMDHDEVLKRVTLLLATVILLLLGIFGALNRTFGSIMPKRGTVEGSLPVASRASRPRRRPYGLEAALDALRPASTPDAADESTVFASTATSPRLSVHFLNGILFHIGQNEDLSAIVGNGQLP